MIKNQIDKIYAHSKFKKGMIIKKNLILETCGQKNHKNGCYIRFKKGKVWVAVERHDVLIDYDKKHNILGIEFYDGF